MQTATKLPQIAEELELCKAQICWYVGRNKYEAEPLPLKLLSLGRYALRATQLDYYEFDVDNGWGPDAGLVVRRAIEIQE